MGCERCCENKRRSSQRIQVEGFIVIDIFAEVRTSEKAIRESKYAAKRGWSEVAEVAELDS